MQRRFKVGDEVVNITSGEESFWNTNMPIFTKGIVTNIADDGMILVEFDFPYFPHQKLIPTRYHEMELLPVFNSPLYKALL